MKHDLDKLFGSRHSESWRDDLSVLWGLSRPYKLRLFATIFCSLILSGINGAIAWSVKPAFDSAFTKDAGGYLYLIPLGVVVLFTLRGTFTYINSYLMSSIGAKTVKSLRQEIYNRLLFLPMSFYTRTPSGAIVSRLLYDVGMLQDSVALTIKNFLVEAGTVVVLVTIALSMRWDLALLSFVVIPLIVYSIGMLGKKIKKTSMHTRKLMAQMTTTLHESLQSVKVIKAFTMEAEMSRRNEAVLSELYRNSMREVRINEFSSLIAEVIGGIGMAIILAYGGYLVITGRITQGTFFSFVATLLMIYTPLKRLSKVNNTFQQGRNSLERVREIIREEPEREGGIEKDISGHIVFRNVSFAYPSSENYALRNINMEIKPDEIVALVGHSGAGKSTMVDLIACFWYPDEGDIFIDGVNSRELSINAFRSHLGMVTQDVVLFNDTIRANILIGRKDASDEEVIEAAKAAYAHDFIMELPEGYDTVIGERGVRLSGGQKQRITIARAILRNPSVLILDEATSSLDTESEQKVQLALEKLMEGRTTIVIAHRLSTIRKASKIIAMEKGSVVQQGSHEELLLQGGLYQDLYNLQFVSTES